MRTGVAIKTSNYDWDILYFLIDINGTFLKCRFSTNNNDYSKEGISAKRKSEK